MDRGLENHALISLFTRPGWAGNHLIRDPAQHVGSDFEASTEVAITLTSLEATRDAALKALEGDEFSSVEVAVLNPNGYRRDVTVVLRPPGTDLMVLSVERNGLNWSAQITDPANERI